MNNKKLHSILVPVFNSKNSLNTLVDRIEKSMRKSGMEFELIMVDDGSQDESFEEIKRLSKQYSFIKGYRLSRNFGHQAALRIALTKSRGDYVAIIDDDLQDPPEIIPELFNKLYTDADVVYGVRKYRKESIIIRFAYNIFYKIMRLLSRIEIPLDAGDFCAMKRSVVNAVLQLEEANPYLRGIRSWVGFKQLPYEYERQARIFGKSGYSMSKYLELAMAGILSFSFIPLRLVTLLGVIISLTGFLCALFIIILKITGTIIITGYTSLFVLISFFGGVQLLAIGILGEYLGRCYENVRKWPTAIVAEETETDLK